MKNQKTDKRKFSELIEQHQAIIHKITMVYANGRANREDLFQEICLQLWKSFPNFREEARFSTWMYRVALNTAISDVRKRKNNFRIEPLREDGLIADSTDDQENVNQLYHSIAKLNRIDKAIILLWLEEHNYDEIASILGISKSNVSVKLVRIKRKLEEMILETVKQKS